MRRGTFWGSYQSRIVKVLCLSRKIQLPQSPKFNGKRFDAAISRELGGGSSYDGENKTNQVYAGYLPLVLKSRETIFLLDRIQT